MYCPGKTPRGIATAKAHNAWLPGNMQGISSAERPPARYVSKIRKSFPIIFYYSNIFYNVKGF
jgi:hypothetical protein